MQMVRLIYTSQMAEGCDVSAIHRIADSSRANNEECGITGVLCYDPGYFLQWIEGPRDAVNQLYGRIVNDPRHISATLLEYAEVDERCFTTWSMACVSMRDVGTDTLRKYSARGAFDPFSMSTGSARGFLRELAINPHALLTAE